MNDRRTLHVVSESKSLIVVYNDGSGIVKAWDFCCKQGIHSQGNLIRWLVERWIEDTRPPCFNIDQPECVACYLHQLRMRMVFEQDGSLKEFLDRYGTQRRRPGVPGLQSDEMAMAGCQAAQDD